MATLAGNIGFKISSRLQIRVALNPWVSKNNAILCVKERDYSSSFPVRYVPRKSLKIKESENSVPVKGLERNGPQSDASELRIEVSDGGRGVKKSVKINGLENSVPVNGLERNELHKQSDASELRIEVSNTGRAVNKSLKTNESGNSALVNILDRNERHKQSDASELGIEVSNTGRGVKKSVQINESENSLPVNCLERNDLNKRSDATEMRIEGGVKKSVKINELENSLPGNGLDRNELHKQSDASELRIEVSNCGIGVKKSITSNQKFQDQNRVTKNNKLLDEANEEFREETNCNHVVVEESEVFEESWEAVEEMKTYQQKDICLEAGKTMQDAENFAIKLLATRAFTAVEMRKKLNGKKFPSHVVKAVITDFQSRGLINDSLYAESFSQSRWSSASWGPRRIKQALFNKGISQTDANKALNLVFKDGESDGDQESRVGMSKHSIDHLFVQASKQWLRSQDAPKETRKTRIIRWLQYRGFNWGVTSIILKKLDSQYPS